MAGAGDFIAGCWAWAWAESRRTPSTAGYRRFHRFGFADFVATLPLAVIPLWSVGLSGAAHLVAFHQLRLDAALARAPAHHPPLQAPAPRP